VEDAVRDQESRRLVHLVLHLRTFGDLDDRVHLSLDPGAPGHVVPGVRHDRASSPRVRLIAANPRGGGAVMTNAWHDVPWSTGVEGQVHAIIEIPEGSKVKYEMHKPTGLLIADRVLY